MARVVVLGSGVVGAATGHCFKGQGHDVTLVDRDPSRVEYLRGQGHEATNSLDLSGARAFVFVALPTPSTPDAGYDLSLLTSGLETLGKALGSATERHTVVVRSTIPPRTTDQIVIPTLERLAGRTCGDDFLVAYAPEFLREVSANEDAASPWMTVLASRSPEALSELTQLFKPFGGELKTFDDPVVAEVIKIAHNAFNATKISFWNEMWRLCQELGVDSGQVASTVAYSAEGSINPAYGIRGGSPYAGACLSKDMDGLLGVARSLGLDLPVISSAQLENGIIAEHTRPE